MTDFTPGRNLSLVNRAEISARLSEQIFSKRRLRLQPGLKDEFGHARTISNLVPGLTDSQQAANR